MEIEVKQNGNQATWFVPAFNQRGIGTIEGQTFSVSWQETAGEQALTGQIVQVNHNGVALQIELSNGLILSRIPPLYQNIIDSIGYYIYKIMLIILCLM